MEVKRPPGDGEFRHVCTNAPACGYIDYHNPKLVVGCVVEHQGAVLLCRRAIEPCRGRWTTPAGFLELNESAPAGAARETWEEAGARVEIVAPFFHIDIPAIGQAYLLYRAKLAPPFTFLKATPESTEVKLVDAAAIDYASLAFSSVSVALRAFADDLAAGRTTYHTGTIRRAPDGAPNDPASYALVDHQCFELRPVAVGGGGTGGGEGGGGGA
jgi:ADP-ribose/FAD diphosphatase